MLITSMLAMQKVSDREGFTTTSIFASARGRAEDGTQLTRAHNHGWVDHPGAIDDKMHMEEQKCAVTQLEGRRHREGTSRHTQIYNGERQTEGSHCYDIIQCW